eukprot:scaffold138818_cov22-Tisochrysis_lutea.AAC.3
MAQESYCTVQLWGSPDSQGNHPVGTCEEHLGQAAGSGLEGRTARLKHGGNVGMCEERSGSDSRAQAWRAR